MFIFMSSKTFLGKYLKACTPDEFLGRQYVTASISIRTTERFKRFAIGAKRLFPGGLSYTDYLNRRTKENRKAFQEEYNETLSKSEDLLSTLVSVMYQRGPTGKPVDIIILCTPTEWNVGYMKILSKYISKRFGVPCATFKEWQDGDVKELNPEEIKMALRRASAGNYMAEFRSFCANFDGTKRYRTNVLNTLTIDDRIAILKEMGLYEKGMKKKDINELIEDKFG